jgi:hypothetical protein
MFPVNASYPMRQDIFAVCRIPADYIPKLFSELTEVAQPSRSAVLNCPTVNRSNVLGCNPVYEAMGAAFVILGASLSE